MKKVYLKSFLVLLAITLVISCTKELMNMPKDALTIEKAKAWYEMQNTTPVMMLKSSKADKKADCTPDWEKAFASSNDDFEVVEAPLTSQTKFSFYTKESLELLKMNNEQGYLNSNSRIVIQRNKKTGLRENYIMTIIGDADYLKTKKSQLTNNTYLKKDKDFSGYVLFHNSDGVFVNGWQFNKGKVIATMALSSPGQSSLRLKTSAPIDPTDDCYLTTIYMIYDVWWGDIYLGEEHDNLFSYITCYSSGGGGLAVPSGNTGGGGGTPGNTNPSVPAPDAIVTNFDANSCVQKIYDELMAKNILRNAVIGFLGENSSNLNWYIQTLNDPAVSARTYNDLNKLNSVNIVLNSTMLDKASGVFVAVTMIHEAIHAEIFRLVASWGGSRTELTKKNWPELYQEYMNHFPSAQHEIMAKKFRDEIKQAIIEYDDACGKPLRDPVQLDALSWSGLFDTFSWDAFILTQGYGGNWNNYETMVYNLREWRESNDWNNCKTSTSINVE